MRFSVSEELRIARDQIVNRLVCIEIVFFNFARSIKSILRGWESEDAFHYVETVMVQILKRDGRAVADPWKYFFGYPEDESREALEDYFTEQIKYLHGEKPIDIAVAEALRLGPFPLPEEIQKRRRTKRFLRYAVFLRILESLQKRNGDHSIWFSYEDVKRVFGITSKNRATPARWHRWAREDGFVVLVKKGNYSGHQADRLRFIGSTRAARPRLVARNPTEVATIQDFQTGTE